MHEKMAALYRESLEAMVSELEGLLTYATDFRSESSYARLHEARDLLKTELASITKEKHA